MPISSEIQFRRPTEERFHQLDYTVMGEAFSIHNRLGKLHNEPIYQEALLQRCLLNEFEATREIQIKLSYEGFTKSYFLDLCICEGLIYELKCVNKINAAHEAQLLNYLFLCDLPYGKIINFRAQSVESRFVSTTLNRVNRLDFTINRTNWSNFSEKCYEIPTRIESILNDWGAYLDVHVYEEALIHILGIEPSAITIYDGDCCVGTRDEILLNEQTALHFSSLKGPPEPYLKHLQRLLKNTQLKNIQWINFAGRQIDLISIKN